MAPRVPYATVPRALEADSGVSHLAVRLYGILTRYANNARWAWPSQKTLAADMECSVRTIERAVQELRVSGWITVERRWTGGPNKYRLNTSPEPPAVPAETTVQEPPQQHSSLIPPDTDDGTHPTEMAALSYRYRKERENLPSRAATLVEDAEQAAGSDLDPEFVAGFQEGRQSQPAAPKTGARSLAMELRSLWLTSGPNPLPGDINVAAVAGQIATWRRSGVTADEIRAMIALFVSAKGYHIERAAPWRAFLARRKALLDAVRTTREAQAAEHDPDYWKPDAYDEKAEADAWYAAQFAGA